MRHQFFSALNFCFPVPNVVCRYLPYCDLRLFLVLEPRLYSWLRNSDICRHVWKAHSQGCSKVSAYPISLPPILFNPRMCRHRLKQVRMMLCRYFRVQSSIHFKAKPCKFQEALVPESSIANHKNNDLHVGVIAKA